jgi:hypothetical protein
MNDQALINVINAKKKIDILLDLNMRQILEAKGVSKNHYFHMFLEILQGKDFFIGNGN